jgi:putative Ca2+/H+ antiporter (TMEM165/GDT1 family)
MVDPLPVAFAAIVSAPFVAELTDKDALLLLTLAAKTRESVVSLAGATVFVITPTIFVAIGILDAVVPILWVSLAGGGFMIG